MEAGEVNETPVRADVSVIIPVYNSGKEAYRAVQSVAKQTLLPREVILIDDASPKKEETKQWLTEIEKRFGDALDIIVLYQEKNGGAGEARNAGWDIAKGEYIAFLDSDDIWHPKKLEVQYNFMESHPDIDFCCHHGRIIQETGIEQFSREKIAYSEEKVVIINPVRYLFKHYSSGGTGSVIIIRRRRRRRRRREELRFLPGKRYSEDTLLWWRYCFRYGGALLNVHLSACFKELYGVSGLSGDLWKIEKGELENYGILRKEGLISWPLCMAGRAFSFLKYIRRMLICALR